jgi:hypothetical protein
MKQQTATPTSVAYTPRYSRPELFGACQVRQGRTPHAAA